MATRKKSTKAPAEAPIEASGMAEMVTDVQPVKDIVVNADRVRAYGNYTSRDQDDVHFLDIPAPAMGAKYYMLEKKGIYVLEKGPCVLRSLSCTYIGSGTLVVRDGVPSHEGRFDADRLDPFSQEYMTANGRRVYVMSPQVIGFWGLDAGLHHGLTISTGGGDGPVLVTACWVKVKPPRPVQLVTD